MKNWPILILATLSLGALGAWGLWSGRHDQGADRKALDGPGKGATSQDPKDDNAVGRQVRRGPVAPPMPGRQVTTRSPTGPTWNRNNPWYQTRGIGHRTRPPAVGAVLFPDGTWLPILNGVKDAPPYPGFSKGYPYAPVVQIVTDNEGMQWYIHADGTRSAPQNMPYGEGGKSLGTRAGWAVGNPYEKKPVVGPDGKIHYEPRKSGQPKIKSGTGG